MKILEKSISLNNAKLFYYDNEVDSKLSLMFIHGNSMSAELFEFQLKSEQLNTYRLIALDLPGHGQSERLDQYSVMTFRDTISGFAKAMSLGSYVIVGHSFGGHFLIQSLPRLLGCVGLVLIGTPPIKKPLNLDKAFLPNPTMPLLFKKDLEENEYNEFADSVAGKDHNQFMKKAIKTSDPKFREDLMGSIHNGDLEDEVELLRKAKIPMAFFAGTNDSLVNNNYIEQLSIPQIFKGELLFIKNSTHSPHLENPKHFNQLLLEFIYSLK